MTKSFTFTPQLKTDLISPWWLDAAAHKPLPLSTMFQSVSDVFIM